MVQERRMVSARVPMLPGKASDHIDWIDTHPQCEVVVPYCRVSTYCQNHKGNLDDQETRLRQLASGRGMTVAGVFRFVGPGWDTYQLGAAAAFARTHGAALLAETTDRFVRHRSYHSSRFPDLQANEHQLRTLAKVTRGVRLVTLLHPDASPSDVRSYQTKRGQTLKGRKGGRPVVNRMLDTKRRRESLVDDVRHFKGCGWSLQQIGDHLGVPKSTIFDWLNRRD